MCIGLALGYIWSPGLVWVLLEVRVRASARVGVRVRCGGNDPPCWVLGGYGLGLGRAGARG